MPAHTKLDAIRYRYSSKDEADLPFQLNVFNTKKGGKNLITLKIETNQNPNIEFKQLERVSVIVNLGGPVDIEVVKQGSTQTELDENSC